MIVMMKTDGHRGVEPSRALIQQLACLEAELFGLGAWSQDMLEMEIAAPARTYMLDLVDGVDAQVPIIRAYGGFWPDCVDAELMTIGVSRQYQRRGLATGLLDSLVTQAIGQGAGRMLLEVRVDNEPALALYRSFGFIRIGLRRRYYQPENVDAYTMALDLGSYTSIEDRQANNTQQYGGVAICGERHAHD